MINTFESVKVLSCNQVTDLTADFKLTNGNSFHILIAPGDTADKVEGQVLPVGMKLAKNDTSKNIPVVVGDWNPLVVESIDASAIDLTKYDVYISEITDY